MWLLSTSRAELKHFADPAQVRYAALSHVWRENELSFQEVQSLRTQHAFPENPRDHVSEKIRRCCIYAEEHGFEWIWIDTCCIDKSSSAEHSEAINSMFVWYALAEVCYVFLDDVGDQDPSSTSPPSPGSPSASCNQFPSLTSSNTLNQTLEGLDALTVDSELSVSDPAPSSAAATLSTVGSFRESEWFTRGWTLQELLAPRYVVFLSQNWRALGTKDSLVDLLEEITGIDAPVLFGESGSLDKVSVARRMSWAAGRKTTRVEDRAYSLMGLFGIHMPTIYGEGANAFTRLQLEIIKQCPDQSIFAWGRMYHSITHAVGSVGLDCPPDLFTLMGVRHPYDDEEMHGLLASSPDAFECSANIIPWNATLFMHLWNCALPVEFRLTSHGMRTNLPLIFMRDDEEHRIVGAVLACADTSDFTSPIVLFMRRHSQSGPGAIFYRVGEVIRDFDVTAEDTPGQWMRKLTYYRGARLLTEEVRFFCERAVSYDFYIHIHYPSALRGSRREVVHSALAGDPADHVIFFPHWTIAHMREHGFVPDRACGQDGLSLPLKHVCGRDVFSTVTFTNEADHSAFSLVFVAAHVYPAARVEGPWLMVFFDWTPDSSSVAASLRCLPRYCAKCLSTLTDGDSAGPAESPAEFTVPKPIDEMALDLTFGGTQKEIVITRRPHWGGFCPLTASQGEVVVLDMKLTVSSNRMGLNRTALRVGD